MIVIPSMRHGIIGSSFPIAVVSGGGGTQLYTLYSISSNYAGEMGNGKAFWLREPVVLWGGASGATALAVQKYPKFYDDSSNLIYYIDTSNKLYVMSGTAGAASFSQVGSSADWQQICAGERNFLALTTGGTLFGWGLNAYGEVGDGSTTQRTSPVKIGTSTWSKISSGQNHSLAIKTDGTLWAWGRNQNGQLGDKSTTTRTSPVQIGTSAGWVQISAGSNHSLGIHATGGTAELFAWGGNDSGQLGDGSYTNRSFPTKIGTATNWSRVYAASSTSYGTRTNGNLYAWGSGSNFERGDGNQAAQITPALIGNATDWSFFPKGYAPNGNQGRHFVKTNGKVYVTSDFTSYGTRGIYDEYYFTYPGHTAPKEVTALSNIVAIDYGNHVSYYIDTSGKIKYSGYGFFAPGYTNGDPSQGNCFSYAPTGKSWKTISIGAHFSQYGDFDVYASFAIDQDDFLWAWGNNRTKGEWLVDSAIKDMGIYLGTTSGAVQTLSPTKIGTSTWSKVQAGYNHVLAIKKDGTLWSWGVNNKGQLGIGSTTDSREPVQVGSDSNWADISCADRTSYAIKTNGTLWAWGNNAAYQLGDGTLTQRNSPVQIGSDTNWSKISAGADYCMAIKTTGTLWGWGYQQFGQIGDGSTTNRSSPVQVGSDTNWSKVSASTHCTLAIKTNGTLWGWGENSGGAVGDGTQTSRTSPVQVGSDTNWVDVSAGWGYLFYNKYYYLPINYATCFGVKSNGTLWLWGKNYGGPAANNNNDYFVSPIQVAHEKTNWTIAPISKWNGAGALRMALYPQ